MALASHTISIGGGSLSVVAGDQHFHDHPPAETGQDYECLLGLLKPVSQRDYHVPRCMTGTRENVFREIDLWLEEPDSNSTPNVLWITGSPGAGKSAILSSLVSRLTEKRRLGAHFFFKRGDANFGDPAVVWRTVAANLVQFHPSLKTSLIEFLDRPGFRDGDIALHFKCMIEDVLGSNCEELSTAPPVIVLDALDECGWDDSHFQQRRIFLETLNRWSQLPRSTKLIVTSRDERVPSSFYNPQLCRKLTLETGDFVSDETQNDIRIFFTQSLDNIKSKFHIDETWPGERAIDQLTSRAAGLFIWADTAVAFVEQGHDPLARLKLVLSGNWSGQSENIDALYGHILDFAFKDTDGATIGLFKDIVGAIIVAKQPLQRDDLKRFLGRKYHHDDWLFNCILGSLSSVIEADDVLRLRHITFAEFLGDRTRCRRHQFVINQDKHHQNMALSCLRIMNKELQFNICGLESSDVRNEVIPKLPERISKFIPSRLSYSCRFWAAHLADASRDRTYSKILSAEVKKFFYTRLLYWLEVMSLIKEVPTSSIALIVAASWIQPFSAELADFARDATRFIASFHVPISESAPHIYLSALPFAPKESLMAKHYLAQFPETLSVVEGRDDRWPAFVNVFTGHTDGVTSIALSPGGERVVSGSVDKTLRVWDTETGATIAGPLRGHTGPIMTVAFSADGEYVASGSTDQKIHLWAVETGQRVAGSFEGHKGPITSLAFSPNRKLLASASADKTIHLWHVDTGQLARDPLRGHKDLVKAVAFSPNSELVVSAAFDKTVGIWNIHDPGTVGCLLEGHTNYVYTAAFSPDGKWIVSGSADMTVRVWEVRSGQCVKGPFKLHECTVSSVAFSPDGLRVVSGSFDETLCVWDVMTGTVVAGPFEGHTDWVKSVAYLPNGKHVISGSDDTNIFIWDIEENQATASAVRGRTSVVTAIAFSQDGQRIVSGSLDSTVCVWDVESGDLVVGPLRGHTDSVRSVAYSPDGRHVVSSSEDETICVWDVKAGRLALRRFQGHAESVGSVAFSRDGKWIVSGSADATIRIWDVESGRAEGEPFRGHAGWVRSVAFSPDASSIVSGSSDTTLRIWNIKRRESILLKGHRDEVVSVAFSPNGKRIASGSADKTVCVWDVDTHQIVVGPLNGHTNWVNSVAFSPSGHHVVSGSRDLTVRVWNLDAPNMSSLPFRCNAEGLWAVRVAYSPSGDHIICCSGPTILILDAKTCWTRRRNQRIQPCVVGTTVDSMTVQRRSNDPARHEPNVATLSHTVGESEPPALSTMLPSVWSGREWGTELPPPAASCGRHLDVLDSIGGPNMLGTCHYTGWTSRSASSGKNQPVLFWVPPFARDGLCDGQTVSVLGVRKVQLDLSRFVHGAEWTRCHPQSCRAKSVQLPPGHLMYRLKSVQFSRGVFVWFISSICVLLFVMCICWLLASRLRCSVDGVCL